MALTLEISTDSSRQGRGHSDDFADRLLCRAPVYFACRDEAREIRSDGVTRHTNCEIHRFRILLARRWRGVLVKCPFHREARNRAAGREIHGERERPRLAPKADRATKARFEFETMARIDEHFRSLDDSRFATVPVFDYWAGERALVLDEIDEPLLARFLRGNVLGVPARVSASTQNAVRNAGAWLREFHTLGALPHTVDRIATRHEFIETVSLCGDYLAQRRSSDTRLLRLLTGIETAARADIPHTLPLVTSHGDFGPRNIFVGKHGRVRVFDTIGAFRAPLYEDLARFLLELDGGCSRVELQSELLAGYFGGPIDAKERRILALFEVRALLGKWVGLVHAADVTSGLRGAAKRIRAASVGMRLRRRLKRLLAEGGA